MRELRTRKRNRLKGYDYSRNGAYFVTFCIKDRLCLLGSIVGATAPGRLQMQLTQLGEIVAETIQVANRNDVTIDRYVVMPNHIHLIVILRSQTGDRGRSPLQHIVRNIKSYVTKNIGFSPWQKSFHDHIIRNEDDYHRIAEYIENNPARWEDDCFYVT